MLPFARLPRAPSPTPVPLLVLVIVLLVLLVFLLLILVLVLLLFLPARRIVEQVWAWDALAAAEARKEAILFDLELVLLCLQRVSRREKRGEKGQEEGEEGEEGGWGALRPGRSRANDLKTHLYRRNGLVVPAKGSLRRLALVDSRGQLWVISQNVLRLDLFHCEAPNPAPCPLWVGPAATA